MNRFARVAALDVNDPMLPWIWAINEQEQLWLAHDAHWVKCAKNGWGDDDEIYGLLAAYGLLRGEKGGSLSRSKRASSGAKCQRSKFAAAAAEAASRLKSDDAPANTEEWIKLNHKIAEIIGCQKSDWCMPSATLKMMWFSAPKIIPMYDQYTFKAIKREEKSRGHRIESPGGYLAACYDALKRYEPTISSAIDLWGSRYPYTVRILDKYLWLRGSDKQRRVQERLKRFHEACVALSSGTDDGIGQPLDRVPS